MPRQARKESGTGIYHVMLRGINRQDIFEEAEDYMRMLSCLQQMLEQYDDQGNRRESGGQEPLYIHILTDGRVPPCKA